MHWKAAEEKTLRTLLWLRSKPDLASNLDAAERRGKRRGKATRHEQVCREGREANEPRMDVGKWGRGEGRKRA